VRGNATLNVLLGKVKRVIRVIIICVALLTLNLVAEKNPLATPGPGLREPEDSGVPALKTFDKGFFDASKGEGASETKTSPRSGKTRFLNRDFEGINSVDNNRMWQQNCAPEMDNPEKYSECYKKARIESQNRLDEQRKGVENRQATPLKNMSPVRLPSMGEGGN